MIIIWLAIFVYIIHSSFLHSATPTPRSRFAQRDAPKRRIRRTRWSEKFAMPCYLINLIQIWEETHSKSLRALPSPAKKWKIIKCVSVCVCEFRCWSRKLTTSPNAVIWPRRTINYWVAFYILSLSISLRFVRWTKTGP